MPSGLSGEINSSDAWFNGGYSFSQDCPDEATFKSNAETYFSYFKTHYDGRFGKPTIEKFSLGSNENGYVIEQKSELSDYFDDNPSKLYPLTDFPTKKNVVLRKNCSLRCKRVPAAKKQTMRRRKKHPFKRKNPTSKTPTKSPNNRAVSLRFSHGFHA